MGKEEQHWPSSQISIIAITQAANARSRHLLESIGMVLLHHTEEHGARHTAL